MSSSLPLCKFAARVCLIALLLIVGGWVAHQSAPRAHADPTPQLSISPATSSVIVDNSVVLDINVSDAVDLYGYEFLVTYDASKVSAVGSFVNGFVDTTTNAFVPSGWTASCAAGTCHFAVTRLSPAVAVNGTGTLAQITFTGENPGVVPLSLSTSKLSDRDGMPLAHSTVGGTLTVYGKATITGTITLQGRLTPVSQGTVTFTDNANLFPPTVVNFSATTGAYTAVVPVDVGGSTYKLTAEHNLYLRNELSGVAVVHDGNYPQAQTMLHGGDANNDAEVDVFDLGCVGTYFELPPHSCGLTGNSDLNEDGEMDLFDLVLVGTNFDTAAPRPW